MIVPVSGQMRLQPLQWGLTIASTIVRHSAGAQRRNSVQAVCFAKQVLTWKKMCLFSKNTLKRT